MEQIACSPQNQETESGTDLSLAQPISTQPLSLSLTYPLPLTASSPSHAASLSSLSRLLSRMAEDMGNPASALSMVKDRPAFAVFSPEQVADVEEFPDSCEQLPWYVPGTYAEDTEVPDSMEDEGDVFLAGESQPLEPLEDIEREVEASMISNEEQEGEGFADQGQADDAQGVAEKEEGDDIELNFGVKLDSGELQVVKESLKILLPTYRP